jgi:hypothetical protein
MNIKRAGIVLVIAGVMFISFAGFKYIRHRSMLDSGMVKPNIEKNHFIRWESITGMGLLIGGILILGREFKVHT